ncbi:Prolyl oligopeptidase family protein [Streptococcus equinus]|uniref:Prolyl oligopeptidase family protein n=1 Tax=Streptococcus equinus TaxID=1335 RepID=A0A1H1ANN7_STREI|nr:alpha/beta hydrolase [Streptococcus equinus]SDQ41202.1 Prolyl oligopeptidase family protein [Streptococcus equinus]
MEKLYIWGDKIPGNSKKCKTDILDIHKEYSQQEIIEKYPGIWDKTSSELGDLSGNDTMVYHQEIEHGPAKMTYEDEPFLIPYIVEGSDSCVIICPGGAYLTKVMEDEKATAEALNRAGISAFILWYRTYPYHAPLMFLDCQRAIRYVRYHASDYGIDPEKIVLIGFSAGGNLAVETYYWLRNRNLMPDYSLDEVDKVDAKVVGLAGVYPAISLVNDKIIAILAGRDTYDNPEKREHFTKEYDIFSQVQKGDVPLFLCAAMDDTIVDPVHLLTLTSIAKEKEIPVELHLFPQGGHGFNDETILKQWKELFILWLKRILN